MRERSSMRIIGKLLRLILLILNILICCGLIISGYSSRINPSLHSVWSISHLFFPFLLLGTVAFLVFWLFVIRKFFIISLLAIVLCANPIYTYIPFHLSNPKAPVGSIKFLTFNTEGFNNYQYKKNGDPNEVLVYLQESDADIICLQECIFQGKLTKDVVEKAMKKYKYRAYYDFGAHNGLGIFSRFKILSIEPVHYKSANNCSIAYTLDIKGDTILLINNHFESNKLSSKDKQVYKDMVLNPKSKTVESGAKLLINKLAKASALRALQADSVAKFITESKIKNKIVCGDFNDSPLSYVHRIVGKGLIDAFVNSGNGIGVSYNKSGMYVRIDHILVSKGFKTYQCTVDRSAKCSDHYPVWCYIKKKNASD
ncbi:MAG: endonuclease/exonuclease/phosphatase family protein [Phocaeicola sp.]|uniref:endonuclease/exonuclease/phosphatase family protein n=1 Tax=Phocaeicola sp. TaxID=2773926 RepID=UPI003FA0952E